MEFLLSRGGHKDPVELPMDYEIIYPPSVEQARSFLASQVSVCLDESFNRAQDSEVDKMLEEQKLILSENAGRTLYNKSKYRLHSIRADDKRLTLNLGVTDYFEYLITNHDRGVNAELVRRGLKLFGNPDAFLSNALGNVAVVESTDGRVVLLKRSDSVQTFVGYYDLPGGHPEPENADSEDSTSESVRDELFNSIKRELVEELCIREHDIKSIINVGYLINLEDGRKPEMLFYAPVDQSSNAIYGSFGKIDKGDSEAVDIVFLDVDNLGEIDLEMTAVASGTLRLFSKLRGSLHETCR